MKVLVLTSLYPNDANPQHGIFVENKVRHRLRHDGLDQTVIAPLPFLPRWAAAIPKYRVLAAIPAYETRFGLAVWRPSYPALPRLSVSLSPLLMYLWVQLPVNFRFSEPKISRNTARSGGWAKIHPIAGISYAAPG